MSIKCFHETDHRVAVLPLPLLRPVFLRYAHEGFTVSVIYVRLDVGLFGIGLLAVIAGETGVGIRHLEPSMDAGLELSSWNIAIWLSSSRALFPWNT